MMPICCLCVFVDSFACIVELSVHGITAVQSSHDDSHIFVFIGGEAVGNGFFFCGEEHFWGGR